MLKSKRQVWRQARTLPYPRSAQLLLSGNDFSGYFGRSFLAGSERLRDNRRMTDAAHNQHSESRRPSDRDRIVTTGPSRFHPPPRDQSASAITPWHLYGSGRTATFRLGGAVDTAAHHHRRLFRHHRFDQNLMDCSDIVYKILDTKSTPIYPATSTRFHMTRFSFMSYGNEMICQQGTLSGYAEWPKVADAMIKAVIAMARYIAMAVDSAGLLPQAEEARAQVEE